MVPDDHPDDPYERVKARLGTDPQPLETVLACRDCDGVAHVAPFIGLNPEPETQVFSVYVGAGRELAFLVHNPIADTWGTITHAPMTAFASDPGQYIDVMMGWLEDQYPDATFTLLRRARTPASTDISR